MNQSHRCPCLLFVLLCALIALAGRAPLAEAADKPAAKDESIQLPKMTVKGEPVCSFGIGVIGTRDNDTRKIKRLYISTVSPGSTAEQKGLQEGDEILAINGEKVAGRDGEMKHGSWLFDLLVDQNPDQIIDIEAVVHVTRKITLRAAKMEKN